MRVSLIAIAASLLCGLVGFVVGYFWGISAARSRERFDQADWSKRKPPSVVDSP